MSLRGRVRAGRATLNLEGNSKAGFRLAVGNQPFGQTFTLMRQAVEYGERKFGVTATKLRKAA